MVQSIDTSRSVPRRIQLRLAELGLKNPNLGNPYKPRRLVAKIIFGGSREQMHRLAFGDQEVNVEDKTLDQSHIHRNKDIEEWAKDIYRYACDKWGEDNIMGFYVHLDETNPHIHCTILPIDDKGQLSYRKVFAGASKWICAQKMHQLHDELAAINRRWGLIRGASKVDTGVRHLSSEEYNRDLARRSYELEHKIAAQTLTLCELYGQIRQAQKRIKGLTTMLSNLADKRKKLDGEIKELKKRLSEDSFERDRIIEELDKKQNELDDVVNKIADKESKLTDANQKLSDIQAEISDRKKHLSEIETATNKNIAKSATAAVVQVSLESIVNSFGELVSKMTSEEDKALFDGTLLSDLAKHGSGVITCAAYLFAGYVNQATEFAKGSGGGGGGSDLPWGRDPKDDDRIWALKCLHQAHRMMKPSVARTVKRKR
ncbi:MAG: plasmid recombination protein [Bacteroidales bacterium]|nr:plasmid recombination protein [Bacteroidales bacterium]